MARHRSALRLAFAATVAMVWGTMAREPLPGLTAVLTAQILVGMPRPPRPRQAAALVAVIAATAGTAFAVSAIFSDRLLGNLVGSVAAAAAAAVFEVGPPLPALILMALLGSLGFARWIMIRGRRPGGTVALTGRVAHCVRGPRPRSDRGYLRALPLYGRSDRPASAAAGPDGRAS